MTTWRVHFFRDTCPALSGIKSHKLAVVMNTASSCLVCLLFTGLFLLTIRRGRPCVLMWQWGKLANWSGPDQNRPILASESEGRLPRRAADCLWLCSCHATRWYAVHANGSNSRQKEIVCLRGVLGVMVSLDMAPIRMNLSLDVSSLYKESASLMLLLATSIRWQSRVNIHHSCSCEC